MPLCGKTLDIHWLLERGQRLVGIEPGQLAVEQFFREFGADQEITDCGPLKRHGAPDIDI